MVHHIHIHIQRPTYVSTLSGEDLRRTTFSLSRMYLIHTTPLRNPLRDPLREKSSHYIALSFNSWVAKVIPCGSTADNWLLAPPLISTYIPTRV